MSNENEDRLAGYLNRLAKSAGWTSEDIPDEWSEDDIEALDCYFREACKVLKLKDAREYLVECRGAVIAAIKACRDSIENMKAAITGVSTGQPNVRPSVMYRPRLVREWNTVFEVWVAVYGDEATSPMGIGMTPTEAMEDFDEKWTHGYSGRPPAECKAHEWLDIRDCGWVLEGAVRFPDDAWRTHRYSFSRMGTEAQKYIDSESSAEAMNQMRLYIGIPEIPDTPGSGAGEKGGF